MWLLMNSIYIVGADDDSPLQVFNRDIHLNQ